MRRRFMPNVSSASSRRPATSSGPSTETEKESVTAVVSPAKTVSASPPRPSSEGQPSTSAEEETFASRSTGASLREECAEPISNKIPSLVGRRRPTPNLAASRGRRGTGSVSRSVPETRNESHEPPAKRVCSTDRVVDSATDSTAHPCMISESGGDKESASDRDKEPIESSRQDDTDEEGRDRSEIQSIGEPSSDEPVCDRSNVQSPPMSPSNSPVNAPHRDEDQALSQERSKTRKRTGDSHTEGSTGAVTSEIRTSRGRGRKQPSRTLETSASTSLDGNGSSNPSEGPAPKTASSDKQPADSSSECNSQRGKRKVRSRNMKGPPEPTTMTMRDLIRKNPTANKMSYADKIKPQTPNTQDKNDKNAPAPDSSTNSPSNTPAGSKSVQQSLAPQVRITADGQVVLDESSLTIQTTESIRDEQQEKEVVYESRNMTTYGTYSRRSAIDRWTDKDTAKFYGALQQVGTDFSLMAPLFPDRTRRQLKNKFKKEERFSPGKVTQALRDIKPIDPELFIRPKVDDLEADTVVDVPADANSSEVNCSPHATDANSSEMNCSTSSTAADSLTQAIADSPTVEPNGDVTDMLTT